MRRYTRQVLALMGILLVLLVVVRVIIGNTYRVEIRWKPESPSDPPPVLEVEQPDVVRIGEPVLEDGRFMADVTPLKHGKTSIDVKDAEGNLLDSLYLSVSRVGTVYNMENGGFTGDTAALILVTLFLLLMSAIMLHGFLSAKGKALYAYSTIFYIGFFFFTLGTGVTMLNQTLRHLVQEEFGMMSVYSALGGAATRFLNYTCPLLLVFSLAMVISNIELLRHNRPRVQNAMGLIIGLLIIGGGVFGVWLSNRDFVGSLLEYRLNATFENVYCAVYVYFECILAGAVICGIRAARHRPPAGRNVIMILGCWFRKDGSLPPLLRGRVDRALEYWRESLKETGREACFLPSGGQGKDEPMPEAEAMKAYLISQGVPERLILTETRSANTYENMLFSRRVMEENGLEGQVVFATTNYHVFRSGIWAAKAGLDAEGIGSRTKWWFWPNAFVRECVGLIANRWKLEMLLLAGIAAFFALLSMTIVG